MLLDEENEYLGPQSRTSASVTDSQSSTVSIMAFVQSMNAAALPAAQSSTATLSPPAATAAPLVPITDMSTMVKGMPTDPDTFLPGQSQWHLVGTWGLHAEQVWMDYTGEGIMVAVMDDGFEYTHADIAANYRTDLDYDSADSDTNPAPFYASDNHGTSVTGTIIADDNGQFGVGVAFDAEAYGVRLDFQGAGTIGETLAGFQYVRTTGADVMNNSWGYTSQYADTVRINFAGTDFIDIANAIKDLADNGRSGLGTNVVYSAGNARAAGDNTNYHSTKNSPYIITVAAMDSDGTYSSFSTQGASILVAAGGTAVWVPDRTGAAGYSGGSDYTNFSGTSAAAPIVSGAVAVILEANPDLGWRDVQEILAYSAQHNDAAGGSWQYNDATNWNGGGLHFSHDYGFGAVDLHAAVRLAETWTLQQTSANMTTVPAISAAPALAIPDTGTVNTTINVATNIEIEHVIVNLDISHGRAGDLIVTLVAPDGTESILVNRPQNGSFTSIYGITGIFFETSSNAHWGENSAGTWTLRIQDTTAGNSGTLNNWQISFMGNAHSSDDLYVYTDDFGGFTGGGDAARRTLTDAGGTDTINLAAVTTNTTLNMNGGTNSTVAGNTLTIATGTVIENAYMGDGADHVTGNAANNIIWGGRGNDTVMGSAGNDTLDGGAGTDTVSYLEVIANFTFSFLSATIVQVTHAVGGAWVDVVENFETFMFSDGTYTRAQLEDYVANNPPGGNDPNEIDGTTGDDVLYGTAEIDHIDADAGNDSVFGRDDDDIIYGGNGNDYLKGEAGNDTIYGEAGNDTLVGSEGDDTLEGGTGNDNIYGGDGNDTAVFAAVSGNFVITRESNAYLTVRDRTGALGTTLVYDDVEGIEFSDQTLVLSSLNIQMGTGWGSSTIDGTAGADNLFGTSVNDIISGFDGNDYIKGNVGNDSLYGGTGNDTLVGDTGDDILHSGSGNDIIYGGAGNDTAIFGANSNGFLVYRNNSSYLTVQDTTAGNYGTTRVYNDVEIIQFNDQTLTVSSLNLVINGTAWGTPADMIGTAAADSLTGSQAADTMYGRDGNDYMRAGVADDILYGENGNDILHGESGNDTLIGGAGTDNMTGGAGNDVFGFTTLAGGMDTISDYAAGDRINITDILTGFTPGVSDISQFVSITRTSSASTFSIDADGGANSFVQAFKVNTPFTGQTAQSLVTAGILVVDDSLI